MWCRLVYYVIWNSVSTSVIWIPYLKFDVRVLSPGILFMRRSLCSRPKMENHIFQVQCAMFLSMDGVSVHEDFVVGHVAGSTTKEIMYYMPEKPMTADCMKCLVKAMQDLAVNKVTLVVDKDISTVAKLCCSALQPRYNIEVVMSSDLIASCAGHDMNNFTTRVISVAKEIMAKDGEIVAKEFYTRIMKGQKNRELAKLLLGTFMKVLCTVYDDDNNIMKFKYVE